MQSIAGQRQPQELILHHSTLHINMTQRDFELDMIEYMRDISLLHEVTVFIGMDIIAGILNSIPDELQP
jgi:ABC-type nickel/cobalt efflux system permease component RcnA